MSVNMFFCFLIGVNTLNIISFKTSLNVFTVQEVKFLIFGFMLPEGPKC